MRLLEILRICLAILGLALCALVFSSVLGRSSPLLSFPGSDELATVVGVWIYFAGMVMATINRTHITGEIGELITRSRRANNIRKLIVEVCVALILGYVAYLAITYTIFTFEVGRRTSYFRIPTGLLTLSMALGFLAMFILTLNAVWRLVRELIGSKQ